MELLIGALLRVLASVVAAIIYDRCTRPLLVIDTADGPRAQGQAEGAPPHEFFHVRLRNRPARWPLSGRKPAWSCQATLEVVTHDGASTVLGPIAARWTSLPEPVLAIGFGGAIVHIPDVAQMLTGRRVDVHNHEDQILAVALKFEGDDGCFLFTNESYAFPRWSRPEWRLPTGRHRLRIALHYDRGRGVNDFWLDNGGPRRDDIRLQPVT